MVLHRYAELSKVCRAAGSLPLNIDARFVSPGSPPPLAGASVLLLAVRSSNLTLKCIVPAQFYGLS